jgi:hypothetical protein
VSWQHINLLGKYDFSDEKLQDSVGIKPPKLATESRLILGAAKSQVSLCICGFAPNLVAFYVPLLEHPHCSQVSRFVGESYGVGGTLFAHLTGRFRGKLTLTSVTHSASKIGRTQRV